MRRNGNHRNAVILAAGEGVRLKEFVREHFGSDRPKQFSVIIGSRSMLQHTIDRTKKLIGSRHLRIVVCRSHLPHVTAAVAAKDRENLVVLPCGRETAVSALVPILEMHQADPDASVALLPSDHFVLEEERFLGFIDEAFMFVEMYPEFIVLLGIVPGDPDPAYGWIEPGKGYIASGSGRFHKVVRFHEKPSERIAASLFKKGCLWNSLVVVARCSTFLAHARREMPDVYEPLEKLRLSVREGLTDAEIDEAFEALPSKNVSKHLLEKIPERLRVLRVDGVHWSDWGNPDRILGDLLLLGLDLPSRTGK